MPPALTAEQVALNNQVKSLPVIEDLRTGLAEISNMIKEEKEQNQEAFDKGNKKFSKMEDELSETKHEVRELREEVGEMKTQLSDGFADMKSAIKNKENEELKLELRGLKREKDKEDDRSFTLKSGMILVVATIILTAIFTNLPNISFSTKAMPPLIVGS